MEETTTCSFYFCVCERNKAFKTEREKEGRTRDNENQEQFVKIAVVDVVVVLFSSFFLLSGCSIQKRKKMVSYKFV